MKHSQAPWTIEVGDDKTTIESKYQTVAGDVSNNDADLIAAAPELLAELQQGLRLLQAIQEEAGYVTLVTQLHWEKLIRKAQGL